MFKKHYFAALLLLAASSGVPFAGGAQTRSASTAPDAFHGLPNVSFRYYDVDGSDEASISESLHEHALARPDGGKAMGATGYRSSLRPFQVGSGAACKITKVRVELGAEVILPRLRDESVVPEQLLLRWRAFIAGLRVHEAGHVRIEYQQVRATEAALIGSRCDAFKANLEAASARARVLQKAYDRETNHGETQGAVLR